MSTAPNIQQLELSTWSTATNCEGVSHEQSLTTPAGGGSSLNWVVGHMVRGRNGMLDLLGGSSDVSMDALSPYSARTQPDPTIAVKFETLTAQAQSLHEALVVALGDASPELLAKPAPFSPTGNDKETVATLLTTLAFHDAYHSGQTGVLRRVVGLEGKIAAPA